MKYRFLEKSEPFVPRRISPLIRDHIAFASKPDYMQCADVQAYLKMKADYESFAKWARKPEEPFIPRKPIEHNLPKPIGLFRLLLSLINP